MTRALGTLIAVIVLVAAIYPFGRDLYRRYEISTRLNAVMDARERAAFREWAGDPESFAKTLLDRCELSLGRGNPACERYRVAAE